MRASLKFLGILSAFLFLLNPAFAGDASPAFPLRLKVISSRFQGLNGGTPVPKDCDLQNFSAYCNESKDPTGQNILLLQDAAGTSYTVICTVDSRWSKCSSLPVGETFQARKDKHGLTILYQDSNGKDKKQFYQLISAVPASASAAAPAPSAASAPAAAPTVASTPVSATAAPAADSRAYVATPPPNTPPRAPTSPAPTQETSSEKVRCNFSSTPLGAEIMVDGKYVGNTPSGIGLSPGAHTVVLSMPGFTEWKRDLTVLPVSELTISAILQKSAQ
jgi:hypothetical protein